MEPGIIVWICCLLFLLTQFVKAALPIREKLITAQYDGELFVSIASRPDRASSGMFQTIFERQKDKKRYVLRHTGHVSFQERTYYRLENQKNTLRFVEAKNPALH